MHHAITSLSRGTKVKASKYLIDDMPYILDWTKANITHSVIFCQTCKQTNPKYNPIYPESIPTCWPFPTIHFLLCFFLLSLFSLFNQNKTFDSIAFEIYNVRKWKNCVRIYVPLPPLLNFCDFILHSAFHIALRTKYEIYALLINQSDCRYFSILAIMSTIA